MLVFLFLWMLRPAPWTVCSPNAPWTMAAAAQDWTLQIKYVQLRDAGVYECQVSVHPPTSIFVSLNVVGTYDTHTRTHIKNTIFIWPGILSLFAYLRE